MKRLTEEEVIENPEIIYTRYTEIYSSIITNYDAIHLYTFKSMSNNIKEYEVFYNRWKKSIKDIRNLYKDIEKKEFEGYIISNQLETISKRMDQSDYILHLIPSNLVVSLITSFDQFFSRLLNYYFIEINGQINIIEETVKLNELIYCNDKVDIQDYFIEKFLNSFFRKSHEEQLDWLDKKLSLNLKSNMPNFEDFIFLCELRNIIIHNDNIPNDNFLKKINIEKYRQKGFVIEPNKRIIFTAKNITFLFETIHLTTTYIFAILSQKYYGKDEKMMEYIEASINENIVDKLKTQPELSILLLNNQLSSQFKHTSEYMYLYRINLCIAYKKLNEIQKVKDIICNMDWSNCSDIYIYAKYVLLNDNDNILRYMKKFTENEWKLYYQIWPLFEELRQKDFFKTEYKNIFNEEYIYSPVNLKISPRDIQKVEREIKRKYEKEKKEEN